MMDLKELLNTLKTRIKFKPITSVGDIILIGKKSGLIYGTVLDINNNVKKNWFNINFKVLTVPPHDVTWILRIPQMTGEIFTIDTEEHFLIAIDTKPIKSSPVAKKTIKKNTKTERKLTLVKSK